MSDDWDFYEDEYDGPDEPWPGLDPEARSIEAQDRRAELEYGIGYGIGGT